MLDSATIEVVVPEQERGDEMASFDNEASGEQEARIIIDAVNPTFTRISLRDVRDDGKVRFINLSDLMNGMNEIHLPKGGQLWRLRSGGLYLSGSYEDLAQVLFKKGYKTVSVLLLSGSLKSFVAN